MKYIRMAKPTDAEQILAIYAPYIQSTVISFEVEIPTKEAFSNRISTYLKEAPWLVYEIDGKIAGYAYASAHRGRAAYQWNREVSVYVDKPYQKQGIARHLYTILFDLLTIQGYTNVLAGIVQPNPLSVQFHKSLGFSVVGTYKNIGFKFGKWHDISWYERFLQVEISEPKPIISMETLQKCHKTVFVL